MAKPAPPVLPANAQTGIDGLRTAIAKAERDGVAKDAMTLRLTHKSAADLKRCKTVGVHELSFSEGEMRFLGVKVVCGGVETSSLQHEAAAATA